MFWATVALEREPVILKLASSWLILNVGGGPADDKPTVKLAPPADPGRASAFLNIRVADILTEHTADGENPIDLPTDSSYQAMIDHVLACLTGQADNLIEPASALPALELTSVPCRACSALAASTRLWSRYAAAG